MESFATVKRYTLSIRERAQAFCGPFQDSADTIPPGWKNNLRWHLGHLVVTPRLLTFGLMGEPLGVSEDFRKWFAKGTSPADWTGGDVPPFDELIAQVKDCCGPLFEAMEPRLDDPFPKPYTTSVGVVLSNPREALTFSLVHDGIHMGLLLALGRALRS